jgi:hypothetical protein
MPRLLAAAAMLAGVGVAIVALRCQLGIHGRRVLAFVGDADRPNDYVRVCGSCGVEL